MHSLRFQLTDPIIVGITAGGQLRHQVSFTGTLIEGALRTRTDLARFSIVLHAPSPDGVTPPECIRVETMFSDEAFIDIVLDAAIIERLMYLETDDDVELDVHFQPGGAMDEHGNPVFETAGHPSAIDWYTNRALGVPLALASVTIRPEAGP